MRPLEYLEVEVEGRPVTWKRTASGRGGRRYNPKEYQDWKDRAAVRFAAGAQLRKMKGDVAVAVEVFGDRVEVRASALDESRRAGTGLRGDVDNYAKAVLDALQAAGVLRDDVQVVDLRVRIRPEVSE